mmetsp:Transcript_14234/g.42173  ORF Transcript_14234/g.42173 Transcript_14234/m.42173 type:complete len:325 (+) Transcript_14234:841-1815(+)
MRYASRPLSGAERPNKSSWNFGSWPVPCSASAPTSSGTDVSTYPCSPVCRSRKREASARSIRATPPRSTAKREPDSLAAASRSRPPSAVASSSCQVSPSRSSPYPSGAHSERITFASSSAPSGVRLSSRLGSVANSRPRSASTSSTFASAAPATSDALATSSLSAAAPASSPALSSAPIFGESAFRSARAAFPSSTSAARCRVSSPMRSTAAITSSDARRRCSEETTTEGSSATSRSSSVTVAADSTTAIAIGRVRTAPARPAARRPAPPAPSATPRAGAERRRQSMSDTRASIRWSGPRRSAALAAKRSGGPQVAGGWCSRGT